MSERKAGHQKADAFLNLKDLRHEIGSGVYSIRSALLNVRQDPSLAEEVLRFALDKLVHAISEIDRVRRELNPNDKKALVKNE